MFFKLGAVLFLFGFVFSCQYEGYRIYEIIPKTVDEADFLYEIAHKLGYDGLHIPRLLERPAHIMVAPAYQKDFERRLGDHNMKFNILAFDLAKHFEENGIAKQVHLSFSSRITFNQYYRHSSINKYLDGLALSYRAYVKVENVGKSYEGRDLKTIRITNGDGNPNKKVIFIDGGIHAREWIAPAAALYVIYQLVENRTVNADLLTKFDWIILPVVNPDGYEYSHTTNRMWRKTRSKGRLCYGADANRNFDFHWGEVGASPSECQDTYRGKTAFSEVETQAVRKVLQSLQGKGLFYLTLHSYGNYILYPWGWTNDLPSTYKDLDDVAVAGYNAIRSATGTEYTYGSSTRVLYAAAGGSDDYAFGSLGFPISITMELPAGGSGFDPPPNQIQGMVAEAWVGIRAMALKVQEKYL